MTTIAIIDDHKIVREGLRSLLEAHEGFQVIGEASDGEEGVELVLSTKPDVAVMDIWMPRMSGVEATRKICRSGSNTKILVLSMNDNSSRIGEVLRAGAVGYIVKDATSVDLCQAIEDVCGGASYLSPAITPRVMNLLRQAEHDPPFGIGMLTEREREVLQLIPDGLSTKEIAVVLGVSRKTIESHRASLMEKLNIHKVSSLVRFAVRVGLVEP
jgi:DNA-binding NarL/FixJ family response regulator